MVWDFRLRKGIQIFGGTSTSGIRVEQGIGAQCSQYIGHSALSKSCFTR